MSQGLIHIYCGEGKGKTTAAMGLTLRALGNGWRVGIVQFLKGDTTGEISFLEQLPEVTISRGKVYDKFSFQMSASELAETRKLHDTLLQQAVQQALNGQFDLLVLDESLSALSSDLLDEHLISSFLANKPENLEVVLTGRKASEKLLATADYVTEMKPIKHPYSRGIPARRGVEY